MKKFLVLLLFSYIMHAQSKHTLFVYKNVMKVKDGFLKGGLHFIRQLPLLYVWREKYFRYRRI